jgi:pSer/pThr/pTyr-binding forkhead associated (FHA) protein
VSDLGSRNGVRVAGARVKHAVLGLGAGFEIGQSSVRLEAARARDEAIA